MSSFINLLLLLLSLSMHACTARLLRYVVDEGRLKPKFDAAFLVHPQGLRDMNFESSKGATSGVEISVGVSLSSHDGDLAKTIKGTKRLARMLLQKAPRDYERMIADDSEDNEAADDLVVMDYAQPKKKPPIHN